MGLGDGADRSDHLPLRDFVYGVDVVDALDPIHVSLMDRVYSQIPGLAVGLRPPPFADGDFHWTRLGVAHKTFAVMAAASQVIYMSDGNRSQPFVFCVFILFVFSIQNSLRRWAGHCFMSFVHPSQQFQIGAGEATGKSMAVIDSFLHLAVFHVLADQPGHLGPASSG